MRQFIIKLIVFLGMVVFCTLLFQFSLPYYWGSKPLVHKMNYLKTTSKKYDTILLGPSTTVCNIIPSVFDKYTNGQTTTFNLGVNGMMFLESSYLLEHFLKEDLGIKNIILQVAQRPVDEKNMHTLRETYFMDFKRFLIGKEYFKTDKEQLNYTISAFLENLIGVGQIQEGIKFHLEDDYSDFEETDGFFDLQKSFERDVSKVLARSKKIRTINKRLNPSKKPKSILSREDAILIANVQEILKLEEKYGVNIYFLHLPNETLYQHMEGCKNLYMGDGKDFPEFYEDENLVNLAHLNKKGATIFSKKLGEIFRKKALSYQN